jgi:alpha-amylase/alpha-mannosidase (GH57 family)
MSSLTPATLALVWHQHQPYYPDDVAGTVLMPWVRLHGTKDYIGMALHIAEVPEFHCTINLVPSLLVQLERYVAGGSDRHLDVSRLPADSLTADDATYLLDHFFMANAETMIRPFARYHELLRRRGAFTEPAHKLLSRFRPGDLRDLQVWNNLTWMHELLFERDRELADFRKKGSGWTETEKHWLLDRQRAVLAEIIPLHRRLSEGGQLELTTTPFYHPILPLLWDKRSARQAMAGCELPRHLDRYPEDVERHLRAAIAYHTKLFGTPPRGMWPSEGSVSQEIISAIADAGIEWIATDEEILFCSIDGHAGRDPQGHVHRPELLYQAWRAEQGNQSLQMVFRDHALSDQIGFHYQRSDPEWAADDLLHRSASIARTVARSQSQRPPLVPIILDGENCWEHYPDGGVRFLRRLYREAARHREIKPRTVSEHLQLAPAVDRIPQLFAGSWIFHNFAIWIGHSEDRAAWDLLHETRRFLQHAETTGRHTAAVLAQAWREIDIAEGSDWFWWYGDDHSSALDSLFDQLFRQHLENVYTLLGHPPPVDLARPIGGRTERVPFTRPDRFLHPTIDGRVTSFFEWHGAGCYIAGKVHGAMTQVSDGLIREVRFGYNAEWLSVRIDTQGTAAADLAELDELRLRFLEPDGIEVVFDGWQTGQPRCQVLQDELIQTLPRGRAAICRVLELAIPFEALGVKSGAPLSLFVELFQQGHSLDRAPGEGSIDFDVPGPEFESLQWQA